MTKFLIPLFLIFTLNFFAQNCKCDSIFAIKQLVEENYAGWFDKIKPENRLSYTNWSEKVQNVKVLQMTAFVQRDSRLDFLF